MNKSSKNIDNNIFEQKHNFKSICSQYIKFGSNRKIISKQNNNVINGIDINKNTDFKISVYENIKEKINDPYNIIGDKFDPNSLSSENQKNSKDTLDIINSINEQK